MHRVRSRGRSLLLACLALAAATLAPGYTFLLSSDTSLPLRWPEGTITVRLMLGDTPALRDGLNYNSSVRAAAELWNTKLGTVKFLTTATATGPGSDNNQINEVFFAENVFGKAFDDDTLAVATNWRSGNRRVESDVIYNSQYKFDSYRGPRQSAAGAWIYDVQRIALHELGHSLGLTHPDEAGQVVVAQMNHISGDFDTLADDDVQGAQALYGADGVVPPNDLFANAAVLTLGPDSTLTVKGSNALATREAGEPVHAGVLGAHSVWYRWTPATSGGATLSTQGSNFNTALAVYTGSTLENLIPIAANDDIESGKVQASKLLFYAKSGTTYQIAVDGTNRESASLSLSLALDPNLNVAPTISAHPASLSVNTGNSVSFSVSANGSEPLAYQWTFNGAPINGATGASYSISSATTAQGGTYAVTVSNAGGSVTSNGATLTVTTPPQPPPSSGGGGGAPSLWFCLTLAALGWGRLRSRRPR